MIWYKTQTMEYYSAMESNEILIHTTTCFDLENIVLNERSQAQKATYCMVVFISHILDM
jgi:hypothetical protein